MESKMQTFICYVNQGPPWRLFCLTLKKKKKKRSRWLLNVAQQRRWVMKESIITSRLSCLSDQIRKWLSFFYKRFKNFYSWTQIPFSNLIHQKPISCRATRSGQWNTICTALGDAPTAKKDLCWKQTAISCWMQAASVPHVGSDITLSLMEKSLQKTHQLEIVTTICELIPKSDLNPKAVKVAKIIK